MDGNCVFGKKAVLQEIHLIEYWSAYQPQARIEDMIIAKQSVDVAKTYTLLGIHTY
jgi:hypothetical protein